MAVTRSPYSRMPVAELLELCRKRSISGVDETTRRVVITTKLKAYDKVQQELSVFRAIANELSIATTGTETRQELLQLIEPRILAKLTADGYFVEGAQGKKFSGTSKTWVLTGARQVCEGRVECCTKIIAATTNTFMGDPRWMRVLTLYHTIYQPASIVGSDWARRWISA